MWSQQSKGRRRSQQLIEAQLKRHELLAVLEENDFFGEQSLLSNKKTNASVRSTTFAELMALQASAFQDVIRDFPWFAEIVQSIAGAWRLITLLITHSSPTHHPG